ncbi:DUF732 domain-containing protein [Mycobacterium sp. CBMA226]|nr:DUF732 domain-containing protein [Mycolicibacterium sp. CBMA 226]QGW61103.1 hypothetical protein ICEMyc226_00071 [Mycolicibacterium sp.]
MAIWQRSVGLLACTIALTPVAAWATGPAHADCVLIGTPECDDGQVDDMGFSAALAPYGITFRSRQAGIHMGRQICSWLDTFNARTPSKVMDNTLAANPGLSQADASHLIRASIQTFCPIY